MRFLTCFLAFLLLFSSFCTCFAVSSTGNTPVSPMATAKTASGTTKITSDTAKTASNTATTPTETIAIDVSSCSDISDALRAIDSGEVSYLIARATQGTNFVDKNCDPVYQFAKSRGLGLGVYHALFRENPRDQARFFSANTKGYLDEAVFFLDIEESGGFSKKKISKIISVAEEFLDEWSTINPEKPIYLYASAAIFNNHVEEWKNLFENRPFWLAIWLHNSDSEENIAEPYPDQSILESKLSALSYNLEGLAEADIFIWQYRAGNPEKSPKNPKDLENPLFPLDTNIVFLTSKEWNNLI